MVDAGGQVVATVFASISGASGNQGGFAVPNALVRAELGPAESRTNAVGTGQCTG